MPDYLVARANRDQCIYSTDRPRRVVEAEGYKIIGEVVKDAPAEVAAPCARKPVQPCNRRAAVAKRRRKGIRSRRLAQRVLGAPREPGNSA